MDSISCEKVISRNWLIYWNMRSVYSDSCLYYSSYLLK